MCKVAEIGDNYIIKIAANLHLFRERIRVDLSKQRGIFHEDKKLTIKLIFKCFGLILINRHLITIKAHNMLYNL